MELLRAGRALLISGRSVPAPHLWLVLTDPEPQTGRFVAVMAVTTRPHTDKTVVLMPGDHPFIRHESNIDYGTAKFMSLSRVTARIKVGTCHLEPDLPAGLLSRVRDGLLKSARTIHAIADYCRPQF